jgi:GT2 family glycosyltransferase/glycosyltransferase involved in cell wall biosynthesis/SAM-dependent methyltransferase
VWALLRRLARRLQRKSGVSTFEMAETIRKSIYFDAQWYLANNPDVATANIDPARHYIWQGAYEGRDPGPLFSTQDYLKNNPDVASAGLNPLFHFVRQGETQGRSPHSRRTMSAANEPASKGFSLIYLAGEPDTPGRQYRVARHIAAAAAFGVAARWVRADELPQRMNELSDHNVLVIWRTPWDEQVAKAVDLMRSKGRKIVFDVDDLMIEPGLAKTEVIDGIRTQSLNEEQVQGHYSRMRETMLAADLCFATTEELAFYIRAAGKVVHVLPNGFDDSTHAVSRLAARSRREGNQDGLIRMGYAGGSRTHQRDLGIAIEAIGRLLAENPSCRLVLFREPGSGTPLIDSHEYRALDGFEDQIEWRPLKSLADLPLELARFDINLAPLEFGNPFNEAKSELKFFEGALVDVPTVASPTGPYRRAIEHGQTGFLAASADDWYFCLKQLVDDPALRDRVGRNAYRAALTRFGPIQRAARLERVLDQLKGGGAAARAFALEAQLSMLRRPPPTIFESDVVFQRDKLGNAEVSVIVPLYNYEGYIVETLDSVLDQTLDPLDLVIVDGCSTDRSLAVAAEWAKKHANRFNRILVLKNRANYGLAHCRNSGFDAAETPFVLPLDADNKLLPSCCADLLTTIRRTGAAYAYPTIRQFGAASELMGNAPYDPQRFVLGNYVDAMALVAKEAWAMVGGCNHLRNGWEDYDFWCRLAEIGLRGEWEPKVLALYRVHAASMLKRQTLVPENFKRLNRNFADRHPWVSLYDQHHARAMPPPQSQLTKPQARGRLNALMPILRCPLTKQKLAFNADRTALVSVDGLQTWPIVADLPVLFPGLSKPELRPADHISNDLPEAALELIRETKGLALNLSAGGSRTKFDHVVEVEFAAFRHTDVIADAHNLPFDDESFATVISMNAFEHYREPDRVVTEIYRVLKPGGRVMIHTAFMQPLHEAPWHFFNCTRYGLAQWFKDFETEKLYVSSNFDPNHTFAWLASEAEAALRDDVSAESATRFTASTVGAFVDLWRNPSSRATPLWTDFSKLTDPRRETMAAGFEFLGVKPPKRPDLDAQ